MQRYFLQEKVIEAESGGAVFAALDDRNVLADPAPVAWSGRRVIRSGWMGDTPTSLEFRSWGKEAWAKLEAWCDAIAPGLERAQGVACLWPHPRHVLSDVQSCVTFLKKRSGQRFEVLLDPAGLLTEAMLPRAEDHLTRAMEALAGHDNVKAVVVSNVEPAGEGLLRACETGRGVLPEGLVRMVAERVPPGKVVVELNAAAVGGR
ncbi:MAG: hypothetical protein KF678_09235 [Phycisphaeraceae bacterium]|nr:hypothetical protein [Phycisphaeraceae bacterium]